MPKKWLPSCSRCGDRGSRLGVGVSVALDEPTPLTHALCVQRFPEYRRKPKNVLRQAVDRGARTIPRSTHACCVLTDCLLCGAALSIALAELHPHGKDRKRGSSDSDSDSGSDRSSDNDDSEFDLDPDVRLMEVKVRNRRRLYDCSLNLI